MRPPVPEEKNGTLPYFLPYPCPHTLPVPVLLQAASLQAPQPPPLLALSPPSSPPWPWMLLLPHLWKSNTLFPESAANSSSCPLSLGTASCLHSRSPSSPPTPSSPCSQLVSAPPLHRLGPHSLPLTCICPKTTLSLCVPSLCQGTELQGLQGPVPTNKGSKGNLLLRGFRKAGEGDTKPSWDGGSC